MPFNRLSESIYKKIKKDIYDFVLPPGTPLREIELAKTYETSRTPVREALLRLEAEGYITNIPGRGASVSEISIREVLEAYEIREILEPFAVHKATFRGLDPDEAEEIYARLDSVAVDPQTPGEIKERERFDNDFHVFIARASGNQLLEKMIIELRSKIARVVTYIGSSGRYQAGGREHKEVLDLIISGDGAKAAELMKLHLDKSKARLIEIPSPPSHVEESNDRDKD